jgi:myo-inositol 2-dehydrogenase/D-chiro-inositol 1-dehydrogenase
MTDEQAPIRAGVVGLGLMGHRHAAILAHRPDVNLVGAADPSPTARDRFTSTFPIPVYEDLTGLLEQGVDAVVIAVPDHAHVEPAVQALTAGCATLLEKPMATSGADARAIADAARANGTPLMIGQTLRFDPRYRQARTVIHSGRIGHPAHCYARRNSAFGAAIRYGDSTSLPWHVSIHDIDAVLWMTGRRVRDVTARASDRRLAEHGHWDALGALLTLDDGTPFLLESSWILPAHLRSGIDSTVEVVGTGGVVKVHGLDEGLRVLDEDGVEYPDVLRYHEDSGAGPSGALAHEVGHFLAAIRGTIQMEIGIDEALHVVDVVEALEKSVREGRTVQVVTGTGDNASW